MKVFKKKGFTKVVAMLMMLCMCIGMFGTCSMKAEAAQKLSTPTKVYCKYVRSPVNSSKSANGKITARCKGNWHDDWSVVEYARIQYRVYKNGSLVLRCKDVKTKLIYPLANDVFSYSIATKPGDKIVVQARLATHLSGRNALYGNWKQIASFTIKKGTSLYQ